MKVQLPNAMLHGANFVFFLSISSGKVRGNVHICHVAVVSTFCMPYTCIMGPPSL